MQIGNLRRWILDKIQSKIHEYDQEYCAGYKDAMKDIAYYFDFPLDDKSWERWRG